MPATITNPSPALDQREVVSMLNEMVQWAEAKMHAIDAPTGYAVQHRFIRKADSSYQAVEVGRIEKPLVTKNKRPGKIQPVYSTWQPEDVLRSAFALGEAFASARDEQLWKAAEKAATRANLSGNDARSLARAVYSLTAIRAGIGTPTMGEMP